MTFLERRSAILGLCAFALVAACQTKNPHMVTTTCGNGMLDPGEMCDPASTTTPCPTSCDDGNTCTTDTLTGAAVACTAACTHVPITACVSGDACCPVGCNHLQDSDCPALCGNGQVEPGETCDGNCPTACNDGNACTTDTLTGDATTCTSQCTFTTVTACKGGDGCCPPSCNHTDDSDCSATCGNGIIEAGETCDGTCPTSCNDGNACTTDTLTGSAANCSASCSFQQILACKGGDGCCPAACNHTNDSDCSATCGNGTVESGETCDGNCPTSCNDGNACTTDTLTGSAANCSAACSFQPITTCHNGDGCCPAGCNTANDSDCSPFCGDNIIEGKESCDGNCPITCNDGNACTVDSLTGSAANCNVSCSHQLITSCTGGDGCCPAGCNHNTDTDCSASCGNSTIEGNETCDGNCPTSCDDSNVCTIDSLIGSAAACSAQCLHQAITQCKDSDGCCPSGCSHAVDNDCLGTTPIGGPCAQPSDCASGSCFLQATTGLTGGYCTLGCGNGVACDSTSHCANEDASGNGVCVKNCTTAADCGRVPQYDCFDFDGDMVLDCMVVASGTGAVGTMCSSYAECAGGQSGGCEVEASGYKGGYCTQGCNASAACPTGSQCLTTLSLCFKNCTGAGDCRGNGYNCEQLSGLASTVCSPTSNGAGQIGDPCTNLWDCTGGDFGACFQLAGGYCTLLCDTNQGTCPTGTTCITGAVDGVKICMKDCATAATCRTGYNCSTVGTATTTECTQ